MSDVRASAPKIVRVAGEVRADDVPANTPRSVAAAAPPCEICNVSGHRPGCPAAYLTLSAAPDFQPAYSGALAVERLDRILRAERDPITPELLREKLGRSFRSGGLARRLMLARDARAERDGSTEAELRAMWGDR